LIATVSACKFPPKAVRRGVIVVEVGDSSRGVRATTTRHDTRHSQQQPRV